MSCEQTAKLIARIAENLPSMRPDIMQQWIQNPFGLQRVLKKALNPSKIVRNANIRHWQTARLDGQETSFVAVTSAELGFAGGQITIAEICERALEMGLKIPDGASEIWGLKTLPQETNRGLVMIFGPVEPFDTDIGFVAYLGGENNRTNSGRANINLVQKSTTRYIFIQPRN